MAFARYYIQRLPLADPPAHNDLIITTPDKWAWARVRGFDGEMKILKDIKLKGDTDRLTLTVPITGADKHLEESVYEILIGDPDSRSDDEAILKAGQSHKDGNGILFNNDKGYKRMDRDPPPPPGTWVFGDVVPIG